MARVFALFSILPAVCFLLWTGSVFAAISPASSTMKSKSISKTAAATKANRRNSEVVFDPSIPPTSAMIPTTAVAQTKAPVSFGPTLYRFQALGQYEMLHYPTPVDNSSELSNSQFLSVNLNYVYSGPKNKAAVDLGAGTFFKPNQSQFAVYDLYFQNNSWLSETDHISLGRKRLNWSEVDRNWNMGLWQPKFAMDPLRPKQQGLTGIFYEHEGPKWGFTLNFSPLYIPNIGPDIREENGNIVSGSRWYRPPSNKFVLFGKENNIYYKIDVGDISRLVNNQGASTQLRYRTPSGLWIRSQFAYKPQNEVLLTREEYKNINRSVNVTVRPAVAFHEVLGADAGMEWDQFGLSVSALSDRPIDQRPEEGWAIQKPSPMQVYGVNANYEIKNFLRRDFHLQVGYMKVNGGDIVDVKSDGSNDEITLFDRRMMFSNAARVEVAAEILRLRQQPLINRTSMMYELDQKGTLFNTQFEYLTKNRMSYILGADILSVENETDDATFLNQFRANDRFYGGISYDF